MMQYPAKNFSFEYKLIGDIVKKYPEMSEMMERYFRQALFEKNQTLKSRRLKWLAFYLALIRSDCFKNLGRSRIESLVKNPNLSP